MVNPESLTKRYYKIGEVAKMFGVATSLIRYWEGEFNELRPQKNNKGVRRFLKEDVLVIDKIYDLVKVKGYKLDGAKLALADKNYQVSDVPHYVRDLEKLKEIKKELLSVKSKLTEIRDQL
ncbi:MerR family transcriptional regulator [Saprospiraceae bacterium]|nr:MerR family transcriptional regulator [Saprospiraceae bacterium]